MISIQKYRTFCGKILLFGEHSVLDGSRAIIIPYRSFSATLRIPDREKKNGTRQSESQHELRAFAGYLKKAQENQPALGELEVDRILEDLDSGLYLSSNIPFRYGLGSSGAVCAALYDAYRKDTPQVTGPLEDYLSHEKKILAGMESFFHGHSSGLDPLCIYHERPLLIDGAGSLSFWGNEKVNQQPLDIFLINTGTVAQTNGMIRLFRRKLEEEDQFKAYTRQYIPLLNHVVESYVSQNPDFYALRQLSLLQQVFFRDLIPPSFQELWKYGAESGLYACKLCGSGGGGYILGFTENFRRVSTILSERYGITIQRISDTGGAN